MDITVTICCTIMAAMIGINILIDIILKLPPRKYQSWHRVNWIDQSKGRVMPIPMNYYNPDPRICFKEIEDWCKENCKGKYNLKVSFTNIIFELDEDAVLFKLYFY